MRRCLDDGELLALIASLGFAEARSEEYRMTRTARELAFVHVDACVACLELVVALLRSYESQEPQPRSP